MNSGILPNRAGYFITTLAILFFAAPSAAHTPHACPTDLPDQPALAGHMEHADILAGKLSFDDVAAHGAALFSARFNRCDGQGRPLTESTGEARSAGAPAFTRASGPEASSCAGCHQQPFAGGAGEFVANVFVNTRGSVPAAEMAASAHVNERNTLGMHGSGLIEMLAREMTDELEAIREDAKARAEAGENGGKTAPLLRRRQTLRQSAALRVGQGGGAGLGYAGGGG